MTGSNGRVTAALGGSRVERALPGTNEARRLLSWLLVVAMLPVSSSLLGKDSRNERTSVRGSLNSRVEMCRQAYLSRLAFWLIRLLKSVFWYKGIMVNRIKSKMKICRQSGAVSIPETLRIPVMSSSDEAARFRCFSMISS